MDHQARYNSVDAPNRQHQTGGPGRERRLEVCAYHRGSMAKGTRTAVACSARYCSCGCYYPFFNSLRSSVLRPGAALANGKNFLHPDAIGSGTRISIRRGCFYCNELRSSRPRNPVGCGRLCALMPYGWYRRWRTHSAAMGARRGCADRSHASFMELRIFHERNLAVTLTGFAFWLNSPSHRKRTVGAFICA